MDERAAGVRFQGKLGRLRNFPRRSPKPAIGVDFEAEVTPMGSV